MQILAKVSPFQLGWKQSVPLCPERDGVVQLAVKEDMGFFSASHPHISGATDLSSTGLSSVRAMANDLPGLSASLTPNSDSLELRQAQEQLYYSQPTDPPCQNVSKLKSLRLTRQTPVHPPIFQHRIPHRAKAGRVINPVNFGTFVGFLLPTAALKLLSWISGSSKVRHGSRRWWPKAIT